jgi:hypothetical protein
MPYISNGRTYTYGLRTLSQIDSIAGMVSGETVYCSDYNKIFTYDGSHWMCSDFIKMINRSIQNPITRWSVVTSEVGGTGTEIAFHETTTVGSTRVIGSVIFGAAIGSECVVAYKGIWKAECSAINSGDPMGTWSLAGKATQSTDYNGTFAFAVTGIGTTGIVDCILMPKHELLFT